MPREQAIPKGQLAPVHLLKECVTRHKKLTRCLVYGSLLYWRKETQCYFLPSGFVFHKSEIFLFSLFLLYLHMTWWQAALHSTICLRIEVDRNNLFTITFHMLVLSYVQLHIFNVNAIFLRELSQDMLSMGNIEQSDNLQICITVPLHIVLSFWSRETSVDKVLHDRKKGIRSQAETRLHLLPKSPDRRWSSLRPLSDRYRGALFRGREVDHSL